MDDLSTESVLSEKSQHDYDLIKIALQNGDQNAYAELLGRYRDSVYYMLYKMVNNKDDADDLTIEAFGKAFKRLEQYTPSFAFSTWLFKIATNNCIDFIRRRKMHTYSIDKTFEDEEGSVSSIELKSEGENPEEKIIKKQNIKVIRLVVNKLKPHYKQLIEMRYFEELSIEEISAKMELPEGTIKGQLHRAREFMANVLKHTNERT